MQDRDRCAVQGDPGVPHGEDQAAPRRPVQRPDDRARPKAQMGEPTTEQLAAVGPGHNRVLAQRPVGEALDRRRTHPRIVRPS